MNVSQLNYNQKLIGLSLLKATNIEGAKSAFADCLSTSLQNAQDLLHHLRKTHVLCPVGMVEKYGADFFLYESSNNFKRTTIDDNYIVDCLFGKMMTLTRAMQFLQEQR